MSVTQDYKTITLSTEQIALLCSLVDEEMYLTRGSAERALTVDFADFNRKREILLANVRALLVLP